MHPSVENRFYDLLGRKLSGECPAAELKELVSILQSHPELQFFYDQIVKDPSETTHVDMETAWLTHALKMRYTGREPDKAKEVITAPRRHFFVKRTMVKGLIAASAAFILVLIWQLLKKTKTTPDNTPAKKAKNRRYEIQVRL